MTTKRIPYLWPYLGVGLQAVGLLLGFVVNFLLARLLQPAGYGMYAFAYSVIVLCGIPLQSGLATLLTKEVAAYRAAGDAERTRGIIRWAHLITVVLSVVAALVLAAAATLQRGGEFSQYASVIVAASLLLPLSALATIRGGVLRGLGRPIVGAMPDALIRPGVFSLLLLCVLLIPDGRMTAAGGMGMHALAAAIAGAFGWSVMHGALPRGVRTAKPLYAWDAWLRALLPLSLLAGIQAAGAVVASIALAAFHPPSELGFYRVAELGSSLVAMPLGAVAAYAAGGVAHLFAIGDRAALQREVTLTGQVAVACALPTAVVLIAFGNLLVPWALDATYIPAVIPMVILCIGQALNAMAGASGLTMAMSGHYTEANWAFGTALLVQIVGAILLVPRHGAVGAAVASAVGTVTWSQLLRHRAHKVLLLRTSPLASMLPRRAPVPGAS